MSYKALLENAGMGFSFENKLVAKFYGCGFECWYYKKTKVLEIEELGLELKGELQDLLILLPLCK